MKEKIRQNIEEFGRHVSCVLGGESPRFQYTIGLSNKTGFELVFAGQAHIPSKAGAALLNAIAKEIEGGKSVKKLRVKFRKFGTFTLAQADSSWGDRMVLGALDFYDKKTIKVMQVLPEPERATIDIPPMTEVFDPKRHRVWQWLDGGWPYDLPTDAVAITNMDALQGYAISELVRWEESEWEIFSGPGPEVPQDEYVKIPFATLLAFDQSLEAALNLELTTGLFREFDEQGKEGPWQAWEHKEEAT